MPSSELYFQTKTELLNWCKKHLPNSHAAYSEAKDQFKVSKISGSSGLLKKENTELTAQFMTFLTEFNLAILLLSKNISPYVILSIPLLEVFCQWQRRLNKE